jgi:glutamyl-tRNA reductase
MSSIFTVIFELNLKKSFGMIGLIGLNYKQAPIHIREKFSFSDSETEQFVSQLADNMIVDTALVLSTCNRTEIYFSCETEATGEVLNNVLLELSRFKKTDAALGQYFYTKSNKQAAEHLFKVAAGLDSLVLGEDQIIGQIKTAYFSQKEKRSLGKVLMRLFEKAIETGKKVRSQTTINTGASSVSAAAVDTALKHYGKDITEQNVLMIGAGETGSLVVQSLAKHGFKSLYIANRTKSKAEDLAQRYNGTAVNLKEFRDVLNFADIVLVATNAPHPVITTNMMSKLKPESKHEAKLLIDLSVPRNISQAVSKAKGITLYSVDDLQQIIQQTSQIRQGAVADAKNITNNLVNEFYDWYEVQKLTPTIIKIKKNLSKISEMHTADFKGSIKNNEDVPVFSNYLTNKYIGHFIKNFKKAARNGKQAEFIEFANELFEVEA